MISILNPLTYWHYVELATQETQPDIYLKFNGCTPLFLMFSTKAVREFSKQYLTKIDRNDYMLNRFIGKLFYDSFATRKSDENFKGRRETIMKTLGINFASRYIPTLIENLESNLKELETNKEIDFTHIISRIGFDFICKLIFGKNYKDKLDNNFNYINKDGTITIFDFADMFMNVSRDTIKEYTNTIGNIFPILNDYNLIKPYTTIKKNCDEIKRKLVDYLKVADDPNSFYSQIKNCDKFTQDELVSDLILLIFAGSDTTSHTTASLIYLIKKNPHVYSKIKAEYEKFGIITQDGLQKDKLIMDNLENCEYAEYTVKETLRIEHVAPETVYNEITEDTEICGVPIQKGSIISINMYGQHFSPQEWHEPLKFIPERFDPEDKYFTSPKTNKARDSYSYIPFSIGVRACPGQTLARLVQKISLPFFIANMEYSVNKEQLENDKIFFNNNSQFNLKITITDKKI